MAERAVRGEDHLAVVVVEELKTEPQPVGDHQGAVEAPPLKLRGVEEAQPLPCLAAAALRGLLAQ